MLDGSQGKVVMGGSKEGVEDTKYMPITILKDIKEGDSVMSGGEFQRRRSHHYESLELNFETSSFHSLVDRNLRTNSSNYANRFHQGSSRLHQL